MKPNLSQHILDLLQQHRTHYISGEELSERLNISRTAIWKHISKLREQGYEIEASRKLGYKLMFIPEPIDVAKLEQLPLKNIMPKITYMDKVESTQLEAKKLAEAGAPQGTVVIAEQQLNGKGRLGRKWTAPYGKGIWMSLVLRPDIPLHIAPQFTILFGAIVARALTNYITKQNLNENELKLAIKWPNDILLNRKKITGILLESYAEEQKVKYIIAGIGINVNLSEEDFSGPLSTKATSLRLESGEIIKRTDILMSFFEALDESVNFYKTNDFEQIRQLWFNYAFDSLGVLTKIKSGDREFEAFPIRIDADCALTVKHLDGTEERLITADIGEINYEITTMS